MTTHIEHIVTEVIPEPETTESGETADKRWHEQENHQAIMARFERLATRVQAEGFDD